MARKSKDIQALITTDHIEDRIFLVRGKKIMLDTDLAGLYGVTTSRLNEQVKRNAERFPDDFTFRLTNQEVANLMSQNATSRTGIRKHGGRRKLPLAFTEHGAIMAASVLNSPRAVEVSVFVVRAFVKLRELSVSHKEITKKLDELERKVTGHDQAIAGLINAIRELMTPSEPKKKRPIGFAPWKENKNAIVGSLLLITNYLHGRHTGTSVPPCGVSISVAMTGSQRATAGDKLHRNLVVGVSPYFQSPVFYSVLSTQSSVLVLIHSSVLCYSHQSPLLSASPLQSVVRC